MTSSAIVPSVDGLLTPAEVRETAAAIAEWQLPSGMIPWFPGGHADAWNHVEAAMALDIGGHRAEAERAYDWLIGLQRPDGAWHQYYTVAPDGSLIVEQDKLDANVCAYVACGVWHHFLHHKDSGFLETLWPTVASAIDFVLDLQTPRGEILWARHADGSPWTFALLTGSSSICHSLRAAIAIARELGHDRPEWERSAAALAHVVGNVPDAFAPKHRWAMDWYYPVLAGVVQGERGREHLEDRYETFAKEGKGIRCVSDRPWITTAETCECALAYLSVGMRDRALELFAHAADQRHDDGRYWTGIVYPQEVHFPADETSTYSAAAVLLAAEAICGGTASAALFVDHDDALPVIEPHSPTRDLTGTDADLQDWASMALPLETHTKRTLWRLTRAIESVHLDGQGPDTLAVALFERRVHFEESARLYESWAHDTGPTAILGFPGPVPYDRRGNVHTVDIRDGEPLAGEWIVLVTDEHRSASLRATALPDQPSGIHDLDRRFAAFITTSPPDVAGELTRIADALAPKLTAPLLELLRDRAAVCSTLPAVGPDDGPTGPPMSAPELP